MGSVHGAPLPVGPGSEEPPVLAAAGREVTAALEMMSGAAWVAETLQAAGWRVQVADSRRARALAPLAAKTDRIDARALAELVRRPGRRPARKGTREAEPDDLGHAMLHLRLDGLAWRSHMDSST